MKRFDRVVCRWLSLSTVSASLSAASLSALAAPPIEFGEWVSQGGQVSASCQGIACDTVVQGSGFLQQAILDNNGDIQRIQTIILDEGASGTADTLPFSTENFVQRNGSDVSPAAGLASRQILDIDGTNTFDGASTSFEMSSVALTGWADDPTGVSLRTEQVFEKSGARDGSEFEASFLFEANIGDDGHQTGHFLSSSQEFYQPMFVDQDRSDDDDDCDNGGCNFNAQDTQAFTIREVSGDMLDSGQASLPSGKSISWDAGDTVAVWWQGQAFNHYQELEEFDRQEFYTGFEALETGFQAYENRTPGEQETIRYFAYGETGPFNWDSSTFGPAPSVPDVPRGRTMPSNDDDDNGFGGRVQGPFGSPGTEYPYQAIDVSLDSSSPEGTPIAFNTWTVDDGFIDADCPSDAECSPGGLRGNGFFQRNVFKDGATYVQTILTDLDASGSPGSVPFSSEYLVQQQGFMQTIDGIINLQMVKDSASDGANSQGVAIQNGYSDRTVLRTGWADSDLPNVEITQRFAGAVPQQGVENNGEWHYVANANTDTGELTGFMMDIYQDGVGTKSLDPYVIRPRARDDWVFVRRERAGDMQPTSGSGRSNGDDDNGGSVSWGPGDDIKYTWVGQIFDWEREDDDDDQVRFIYYAYRNVTDGRVNSYADREDGPGPPRNWNEAAFGPRPVWRFPGGGFNND